MHIIFLQHLQLMWNYQFAQKNYNTFILHIHNHKISHVQDKIALIWDESVMQAFRWVFSSIPKILCMLSASLHLHWCSPAGAHLQVRPIWHRWLSDSIIWELPCPDQHWAHTGPDKRHPWQLVGHVFPQPRWTTEFSGYKPAAGVRLCKWDKETHCGLECLLWSWTLSKE